MWFWIILWMFTLGVTAYFAVGWSEADKQLKRQALINAKYENLRKFAEWSYKTVKNQHDLIRNLAPEAASAEDQLIIMSALEDIDQKLFQIDTDAPTDPF